MLHKILNQSVSRTPRLSSLMETRVHEARHKDRHPRARNTNIAGYGLNDKQSGLSVYFLKYSSNRNSLRQRSPRFAPKLNNSINNNSPESQFKQLPLFRDPPSHSLVTTIHIQTVPRRISRLNAMSRGATRSLRHGRASLASPGRTSCPRCRHRGIRCVRGRRG